jgi:hypothetical protein
VPKAPPIEDTIDNLSVGERFRFLRDDPYVIRMIVRQDAMTDSQYVNVQHPRRSDVGWLNPIDNWDLPVIRISAEPPPG